MWVVLPEAVACHEVVDGALGDAEFSGGLGFVFPGADVGADEGFALDFVEGEAGLGKNLMF